MKLDLIENVDYYINKEGKLVFTREYHLKRGFCCKPNSIHSCLHCPYKENSKVENESNSCN